MKGVTKAIIIGLTSLAFVGGVVLSMRGHQADNDEKTQRLDSSEKKHGTNGKVLKLDRDTQERIGIELQAIKPVAEHPELTVYGTLEQDPSEEFVLRSPLSGIVVDLGNWPSVGANLPEHAEVGTVRPRLTALDQLTLKERLASTRSEVEATQSSVEAAQQEVNRLRQLNSDNKNASDKALQEAVARVTAEEARFKAAQASVQLIEDTLQPESNSGAVPLKMQKGGQVAEVFVQPGESVESGQPLIRVVRFDHLLAHLYLPPGQIIEDSGARAWIAILGHEDDPISGARVALVASVDPKYQGQTFLFRISTYKRALRPGQAVSGRLPLPGPEEHGLLIPSRAIVRFQGQAWAYVEIEPGKFVRRVVPLERQAHGGWLVTSGFRSSEQVVLSGAQLLLSEEMKSQLESDEE